MAGEGMHRCNVTILDGDDQITHWTGSPSEEGGALRAIDMTPVGGPPTFVYCGINDRDQIKFNVETKILGATDEEQYAFIARYARGTIFTAAHITGLPLNIDWIVENATVRHSAEGNNPSTLSIVLAELGVTGS